MALWGGLVGTFGLAVSVIGFVVAIYQIRRSRDAASAARDAALEARAALRRDLTIADLARGRARIQELKEFHRSGQWQRALDRYPDVGELLMLIRNRHENLTDDQQRVIQDGVMQIRAMERSAENALNTDTTPDTVGYNEMLSEVQAALSVAESQLQEPGHGGR